VTLKPVQSDPNPGVYLTFRSSQGICLWSAISPAADHMSVLWFSSRGCFIFLSKRWPCR